MLYNLLAGRLLRVEGPQNPLTLPISHANSRPSTSVGRTAFRIFPTTRYLDSGTMARRPKAGFARRQIQVGFQFLNTRITNRMDGKLNVNKGANVKLRLMVVSTVGLFVMAGVAHSQDMSQTPQSAPQQSAAMQASSPSTGMESYGGTPDTRIQSGAKHARPCRVDPQCNVFFGGS
jgi:hypothetical protein